MSNMTQTTEISRTTSLVTRDGQTIGKIVNLGGTYRAIRKTGTATDMRRVSQGFRTVENATRWIEQA